MLLTLALLVLWTLLDSGAPAYAIDCDVPAVPRRANEGWLAQVDQQTNPGGGDHGNTYTDYGWSGLTFYECGHNNKMGMDTISANLDSWVGNFFMSGAALLGAVMAALNRWAADPASLLSGFDNILVQLSQATKAMVFDQWAGTLIGLAVIVVCIYAFKRNVRQSMAAVGAVLLAGLFIALIDTAPLKVAKSMDGVVSSLVAEADQKTLAPAGIPSDQTAAQKTQKNTGNGVMDQVLFYAKPDDVFGAILKDKIIMSFWRQGTLGNSTPTNGADKLYKLGTMSYDEANTPQEQWGKKRLNHNERNHDRGKAAEELASAQLGKKCGEGPSGGDGCDNSEMYQTIKGDKNTRADAGFWAFLTMIIVGLVRIPAMFLVVLGVVVMRMVPIIGPFFALLALLPAFRPAARVGLNMLFASIINVAIFGILASVHTGIVAFFFKDNTIPMPVAVFILAVITFLWLRFANPFMTITRLATGNSLQNGLSRPSLIERFTRRKESQEGQEIRTGAQQKNETATSRDATETEGGGEVKVSSTEQPAAGPGWVSPQGRETIPLTTATVLSAHTSEPKEAASGWASAQNRTALPLVTPTGSRTSSEAPEVPTSSGPHESALTSRYEPATIIGGDLERAPLKVRREIIEGEIIDFTHRPAAAAAPVMELFEIHPDFKHGPGLHEGWTRNPHYTAPELNLESVLGAPAAIEADAQVMPTATPELAGGTANVQISASPQISLSEVMSEQEIGIGALDA
ncbi:MAG: hypothetical protein LBE25_09365 [Arthrobacter sp.]|jgi:hypothetical protein|nr:hypothetical protein [Arthrobacter sp.]